MRSVFELLLGAAAAFKKLWLRWQLRSIANDLRYLQNQRDLILKTQTALYRRASDLMDRESALDGNRGRTNRARGAIRPRDAG